MLVILQLLSAPLINVLLCLPSELRTQGLKAKDRTLSMHLPYAFMHLCYLCYISSSCIFCHVTLKILVKLMTEFIRLHPLHFARSDWLGTGMEDRELAVTWWRVPLQGMTGDRSYIRAAGMSGQPYGNRNLKSAARGERI